MVSTNIFIVGVIVLMAIVCPGWSMPTASSSSSSGSSVMSKEDILENNGISSLADDRPDIMYAHCKVMSSAGYRVSGNIYFREVRGEDIEIKIDLQGFQNNRMPSEHGFHAHTYGDLSDGCASALGHFNPSGTAHGSPTSRARHVGDFGNIVADARGRAKTTLRDSNAKLFPGARSILGRAIVIHAGKDDLGQGGNAGSRASGNAGPRIGCCVIGIAKSAPMGPIVIQSEAP